MPSVSIGLSVYHGGRFLKEVIDSLLAQAFNDFEFIISGNESTERTGEICRDYSTVEKGIRYIRNEQHLGVVTNP